MAEALALVASVVTFIAAADQIKNSLKCLSSTISTRSEIESLINDVTNLELSFRNVKDFIEGCPNSSTTSSLSLLQHLLDRGNCKILQLNKVIHYDLLDINDRTGALAVHRSTWPRKKDEVVRIQRELKSIRLDLTVCLETLNANSIMNIRLQVEEISTVLQDLSNNQRQVFHLSVETLERHEQCMEQLHQRLPHREAGTAAQHQTLQLIAGRSQLNERQVNTGSLRTSSPPNANTGASLMVKPKFHHMSVHAVATGEQSCRPYCECVCHKRQRLTSARSLQAIFGSLSMKYHSLPLISTCNIRSCRRREGAFLHIRYRFPSWLVAQAISLMASSAGSGGPEASLRVNSLISSLHPIFSAIESANISGIKDMLASREVSLHDISESGFTPLDFICEKGLIFNSMLFKALVYAKADFHSGDPNRLRPIDKMWEFSFFFPALRDLLSVYCHLDDYRDEQRFTEIHEEVLGLKRRGLKAAVGVFPWKLNDQDAAGRTALYWAVVSGDYQATQTLIEAGADPNICDLDGYSPLHRACALYRRKSQAVKLVTTLLHAGANVNAASNTYLETAFHFSTIYCVPAVVALLLDHGSNINAVNVYGLSALNFAVRRRVSNCIRQVLLDRGANTGYIRMKGITLLHDAAFTGNAETYRFLRRARISDIKIERKDEYGQTALGYFWSRKVISEALLLAYLELECSLYAKGWEGYMNYLEQQHPDIHDHVKHLRPKGYDIENRSKSEEIMGRGRERNTHAQMKHEREERVGNEDGYATAIE